MAIRKYKDVTGSEQTAVDGPKGTVLVTRGKLETRFKVWFSDSLNTLHTTGDYRLAVTVAKQHAGVQD